MGYTTHYDETLPFVANEHSLVRSPGRQIDWTQVPSSFGGDAVLVKLNGAVSVDATSITVDALLAAVPSGTLLHFGESKEFVRTTAAAAAGATSITVEAVPTALEDNDEAYYWPGQESKEIPAGTVMAELSSGKIVPRSDRPGSETATGILESTAVEETGVNDVGHGVIVGGVIFQNLLPDFSNAAFSTFKSELVAAGVGMGYVWETYADNTA